MRPIPLNPETEAVARRVVWFEPPADALEDPVRFMAYAMRHATHEDMKVLRRYVSDEDFREALEGASRHHRPALVGLLEFQDRSLSPAAAAPSARWNRCGDADVRNR